MATRAGTRIPGPSHRDPAGRRRTEDLHSTPRSSHHAPMKMPDLRFEQSYLKGISRFLRTELVDDGSEEGHLQVVRVDWGSVAWVTFRDQLLMPLLQGLVWGLASQFIPPLSSFIRRQVLSIFGIRHPRLPSPKTGEFKDRMRDWSKGLSGGAEANIALAK